ncbi:MAG: AI-2E family transporter, partial [Thermomicrobiales bacterium]
MTHPSLDPNPHPNGPAMVVEGNARPGITPFSLLLVLLIGYVIIKVQLVMVLLLLSLLFATIIERPVHLLERRGVPRGLAILAMYVSIVGVIALGVMLIAPTIAAEAHTFRSDAPAQLRELRDSWSGSRNGLLSGPGADALSRAIDQIDNPSPLPKGLTVGIVAGIGGGVVGALTVFVIAFYYLMEKSFLRRLILHQVNHKSRARVGRVWDDVEAQVGRWLGGQLTLCLIIGGSSLIGYGAMGVRFWPLLGLWAGLTEAIPIVGPWLGGIPAVIIAMTQSWNLALMVGGFVVLLQLMENTVLVPRVMKGAVGLSPLTVFTAILTGTAFMGIAGALLAIPVAAAVQVIVVDALKARRRPLRPEETAGSSWRWMRGQVAAQLHEFEHDHELGHEHGHSHSRDHDQPAAAHSAPPSSAHTPSAISTRTSASWSAQVLARAAGQAAE